MQKVQQEYEEPTSVLEWVTFLFNGEEGCVGDTCSVVFFV